MNKKRILISPGLNMLIAFNFFLFALMMLQDSIGLRPSGVVLRALHMAQWFIQVFVCIVPAGLAGYLSSDLFGRVFPFHHWFWHTTKWVLFFSIGLLLGLWEVILLVDHIPYLDIFRHPQIVCFAFGTIVYWLAVWAVWPPIPDEGRGIHWV